MPELRSDQSRLDQLAEEFAERYRRGERPTISEFVRQHPDLARQINELFPALALIEQVDHNLRDRATPPGITTEPPLSQLGDFRIIRQIGRGGMGIVYEAEQVSLGRRVALKLLPKQALLDARHKKRFLREAKAAARLHHTNIVPVFGVGEQDGLHYYVMQFIHGLGLDEVLLELQRLRDESQGSSGRQTTGSSPAATVAHSLLTGEFERTFLAQDSDQLSDVSVELLEVRTAPSGSFGAPLSALASETAVGRLSDTFTLPGHSDHTSKSHSRAIYWQSVASIGLQAAQALQYAHDQGIVHRDVKPGNLLLDVRNSVWVTDFGLAKAADQQDLTQTGDVVGTLRYMAPEQFNGRADARSDVYSLGLTLYELLALRPAFDERDRHKLVKQMTSGAPPRLRSLDRQVPRDLETIVHKAIDREPSQRYQTAGELAADLDRYLGNEPIRAKWVSPMTRFARWVRRSPVTATLLSIIFVLAVGLVVLSTGAALRLRVERDARGQALRQALLTQARLQRTSGIMGQRFESLAALGEAAALRTGADLRDEAITCMTLDDLRTVAQWPATFWTSIPDNVDFDPTLQHFVEASDGMLRVCSVPQNEERVGATAVDVMPLNGVLRGARFSPDGRLLAVRYGTQEGQFLDVWAWVQQRRLWQGTGFIPHRGFDFSPDGRQFVTATPQGEQWTLSHIDLQTGRERAGAVLPAEPHLLRFNWRGDRLAVSVPDAHQVCIFRVEDDRPQRTFDFNQDVYAFAWRPDDEWLAVGRGFEIELRHAERDDEPGAVLSGHRWVIHDVMFEPQGRLLLSRGIRENVTRVWDLQARTSVLTAEGQAVRLSADGRRVACRSNDTLGVWEFADFPACAPLIADDPFSGETWESAVHPGGRLMAAAGPTGTWLWDLHSLRTVGRLPTAQTRGVCIEAATGSLLTAGAGGLARWPVRIVDDGPTVIGPPHAFNIPPDYEVSDVACSRDGRVVAALLKDRGEVLVFRGGESVPLTLSGDPHRRWVAVSDDGQWVAACNYEGRGASVWETSAGTLVRELPDTHNSGPPIFAPGGRWLVLFRDERCVFLDTRSWTEDRSLTRSVLGPGCIAIAPDGRTAALADSHDLLKLVDLADMATLATLRTASNPGMVFHLAFSPDGGRLVASCDHQAIRVWDLARIRRRLRELNLDWEATVLPVSDVDQQPMEIRIVEPAPK